MKIYLPLLILVLTTPACTDHRSLVGPEEPAIPITFTINVPTVVQQQILVAQYGASVAMSPLEAQGRFDYTAQYGGAPNVYVGSVMPPWLYDSYLGVGITVAPERVAGMRTFTGADWPLLYGETPRQRYEWVGKFAAAVPKGRKE